MNDIIHVIFTEMKTALYFDTNKPMSQWIMSPKALEMLRHYTRKQRRHDFITHGKHGLKRPK